MQEFFTDHWEVAALLFNVLVLIIVTLGVALVRVQLKHIDRHQSRQDRRLEYLETSVGNLTSDGVRTSEQIGSLSKLLDHHFDELTKDIEQNRQQYEESHKELRSLLQLREAGG